MVMIAHGGAHSGGLGTVGVLLIVLWVLAVAGVIRWIVGRRDTRAPSSTSQAEQDFDPPTTKI
jgi:hypothetical protein